MFQISRYKTILSNFTYLSILNGLDILLPLAIIPYITNVVGATYFGHYAFVLVLVQNINILTSYGYLFSATKKISQSRDDLSAVSRTFCAVIAGRLLIAVAAVAAVLLLSGVLFADGAQLFMFLTALGMIFGDVFIPTWLFQGLERMKYVTIVNSASKIAFTLLVILVVREKQDYRLILLMSSAGYILAASLSMILVRRQFGLTLHVPSRAAVSAELREGLPLFLSTIGMSLYRNINVLVLNFFVSSASVGVYALAEKVIKACQSLINPISQALFPYFGYRMRGGQEAGRKGNIRTLWKISAVFAVLLLMASACIYLFSGVLSGLLGDDFDKAAPMLDMMIPVLVFGCLNYLLGFVGLVNMNRQRFFFYAVMSSGTVALLTLVALVPLIGVEAGAIAMDISEIILFICCSIKLIKIYRQ
ncbi:MAG: oligosaccharide flippase family protein [Prevotella sp.]|nr:oligosaccharide flippase family protein [Prevotella sp.]